MLKPNQHRLKIYKEWITDVGLEISQSEYWRKIIFSANYNQKILINSYSTPKIPKYVESIITRYGLQFYVTKISECPIDFGEGAIIFKFESLEFPDIIEYSGN